MARPLRIEYPGALYHVTSRGDRREPIYEDSTDRSIFLQLLGEIINNFRWICTSYCLMGNHYHLVIETPRANLSRGMRQLNGQFTQKINRRHQRVGHVFQGRYKAILVDRESYFLELSRYVVLNPVRAGLVDNPAAWPWSSYRGTIDSRHGPEWLARDELLGHFSTSSGKACRLYTRFVSNGIDGESPWQHLNRQIFMGDEEFIRQHQPEKDHAELDPDIPRQQQMRPPPDLAEFAASHPGRNEAMIAAYRSGGYSYHDIARYFGVHYTTVGRVIRGAQGKRS